MFAKIALVCMSTLIINKTDKWTDRDTEVVKEAAQRCAAKFPSAPCVKYFVKKAEQDYHVVCGAPTIEEGEEVEIE